MCVFLKCSVSVEVSGLGCILEQVLFVYKRVNAGESLNEVAILLLSLYIREECKNGIALKVRG